MKKFLLGTALAAIALTTSVHAATPVALLTPVSFDPSTDKRMEVRTDCKLDEMLATHIGDALRKSNKGQGTTTSTDGDVLKVTVTTIWGAGGNNWTGPKGLVLHTDLVENGKVQRSIDLHRTTMGGILGPFTGICHFMDRNAKALARDLVRWSTDARFVPDEAPLPATGASEAEPAKK